MKICYVSVLLLILAVCTYGQYYNTSITENVVTKSGKTIPTLKKLPKRLTCPNIHNSRQYWDNVVTLPVTIVNYYKEYNVIEWSYINNGMLKPDTGYFFIVPHSENIKKKGIKAGQNYFITFCQTHKVIFTIRSAITLYPSIAKSFWKNLHVLPIEITSKDSKIRYVYWKYEDEYLTDLGSFYVPDDLQVSTNDGNFISFEDIKPGKYFATYYDTEMILYGLQKR